MMKKRILSIILMICSFVYFLFLLRIIIFKNGINSYAYNYNLHFFDFINQWNNRGIDMTLLVNVLGNIMLFVPLSIILLNYCKCLNNINIIFINFFTSLSFELIQLSTGWGTFDVDDILLNTIGGIIGLIIYRLFNFKQNNFTSIIFLINFGIIGYISLYTYKPSLLLFF
ncbi:MAG: VanZ family protein [[Clostridium] spiroforme]|uniref:VanZ family protein n=2 Tax=Coprobacillaceae TaxID=2810280 RepID=A0A943EIP6_9FIRM|nr:VanZ family protein [Thomasclavelia spiroformis]